MAEDKENLEEEGLVAYSYTGFFNIRRRIRRINDIVVPLREGLGVDQFIAILVGLVLAGIGYGLFVSPLVSIFQIQLNFMFFVLWFLTPAFIAGQRISKPMPHGKTISGFVASKVRALMDDPVHRRGVPQPRRAKQGKAFHFQREFAAHPSFVPVPATPSPQDHALVYHGEPVQLEDYMALSASKHSEKARIEHMARRNREQTQSRRFLLEPRAHVVMDD